MYTYLHFKGVFLEVIFLLEKASHRLKKSIITVLVNVKPIVYLAGWRHGIFYFFSFHRITE